MAEKCGCYAEVQVKQRERGGPDLMYVPGTLRVVHCPTHAKSEAMAEALLCTGGVRGDLGWHADDCDKGRVAHIRSCSPFCELARAALPEAPDATEGGTE